MVGGPLGLVVLEKRLDWCGKNPLPSNNAIRGSIFLLTKLNSKFVSSYVVDLTSGDGTITDKYQEAAR